MTDFAQKLMNAAQQYAAARTTRRSPDILSNITQIRIGLWPIRSSSNPELAMGVGMILGALIEQWPQFSIYRLVQRIDKLSIQEWSVEYSQFDVDDWEMQGLDENAAIWGALEFNGSEYHLDLYVENDASQLEEPFFISIEGSISEILNQLKETVIAIAQLFGFGVDRKTKHLFAVITDADSRLTPFLESIFEFERTLFLETLSIEHHTHDRVSRFILGLIEQSQKLSSDFGAWVIATTISRVLCNTVIPWGNGLISEINDTARTLRYPVANLIIAKTLHQLDFDLQAYDLLEDCTDRYPLYSDAYLTLAELYSNSNQVLSAIDVYQRGIETGNNTSAIFEQYAFFMNMLEERQIELRPNTKRVSPIGRPFVERYVFSSENSKYRNLVEASEALRRIVTLEGVEVNLAPLSQLVTNLLMLENPDAWTYVALLVERDTEGNVVNSIIDRLQDDDFPKLVSVLSDLATQHSESKIIQLNLARAFVASGDISQATEIISKLSTLDADPEFLAEIVRLRLTCNDLSFDEKIWDIRDMLNSKRQVDAKYVEFLETTIENEPLFIEGYLLLAESYLSWHETDDALEVLLDAQAQPMFDSAIVALLANVLWDVEEEDLALGALKKGLLKEPGNATLLSLMGKFSFDTGDNTNARNYLIRAEETDPSSRELKDVRAYISNRILQGKLDK